MSQKMARNNLLVYVHFPWCLKKCPYCDFLSYSTLKEEIPHLRYAEAVCKELEIRSRALSDREVISLFFGGGTPSLWKSSCIKQVIDHVKNHFHLDQSLVEITVECNPTSLDGIKIQELIEVGVTRLSIGVQSLNKDRLLFLGRLHDEELALDTVKKALERNQLQVSSDLIYNVSTSANREQSPDETIKEALDLVNLGVTHLSMYGLTIEPGTAFGSLARKGKLPIASEDNFVESFYSISQILSEKEFDHYEVSNFAKSHAKCIHNLGYWNGMDYLGLGCGAVGTLSKDSTSSFRYKNLIKTDDYVQSMEQNCIRNSCEENLDPETRFRERLMLGLRLREGFDWHLAAEELEIKPWTDQRNRSIEMLIRNGKILVDGTRLSIPHKQRIWTDQIACELF